MVHLAGTFRPADRNLRAHRDGDRLDCVVTGPAPQQRLPDWTILAWVSRSPRPPVRSC